MTKSTHTASVIIPVPSNIRLTNEKFPLEHLRHWYLDPDFAVLAPELEKLFRTLDIDCTPSAENEADYVLKKGAYPVPDVWRMTVSTSGIASEAGERSGARYVFDALTQMLFASVLVAGRGSAVLDGAVIRDIPRFSWRGFHLDSARHFQNTATIKRVLRVLAHFRINVFHWHLTDNQGWRFAGKTVPLLDGEGTWSDGQYTPDDLREIAGYARDLGIRIVPEVDVPGHSARLLAKYPQFACDPADPGSEWCLGNPESLEFLKRLFSELMDLFPDSPVIHIGGDEAETDHWEKCPKCQAAMRERNLHSMRELENDFMVRLSRFVVERGRSPMIWGTCSGQVYPTDTIIQVWLDIREPLKIAAGGNKMVYSVHNSLYFDYPANLSESWEPWMFELSERGVYMTEPYIIWPKKVKNLMLGTEACLWTEAVPQHRVMSKIFPRIFAYSECAWSAPERKSYADLVRRRELLEASGLTDYLKEL